MWAQQLVGPREFAFREVPSPRADALAQGEVLVATEAGGICGSDMPFYKGSAPNVPGFSTSDDGTPPGLPMHEIVGTVIGQNGTDLALGDRVVGWATSVDGLSELVVTRASSLVKIDDSLTGEQAVALQPLACVIYAVDRIPSLGTPSVTILGAGPIGVLFAHVLRSRGVGRITAVDAVDRADVAERFGIDEVVLSTSRAFADTCRADAGRRAGLVIEAIGHQSGTLLDAVDAVAEGGTIFYFGIVDDEYLAFPFAELARRNATLMTGFTEEAARRGALAKAVEYAARFPDLLAGYVTNAFPLADAGAAYAAAAVAAVGQLKIVVTFDPVDHASPRWRA